MNLSPVLKQRFFDANGLPLAGGLLYSYAAGTSTPQATHSNSTGTTNTNPVTLDASGYADVWLDPNLSYKFVLKDSGGVTIFTEDSVSFPFGVAAWNANTVYSQGNVVQDSSGQGLLYVSLTSNNQGNALTNVAAWRVFGGNVRTVSSNQTSPALLVTDDLVRSNSTAGALTHTLPPCATTPIGKRITVKDVGTGGFTTSVKGSGTDNVDGANTFGTALVQNQSATFENNGTSWDALGIVADGAVTTAKLAAGAVTLAKLASRGAPSTSVGVGGVAVSISSAIFTSSSATYVTVTASSTNVGVTVATTGRPVRLQLQPDGSGNEAIFGASSGISVFQILRNGTSLGPAQMTGYANPGAFSFLDTAASAGSNTYTMQAKNISGGTSSVQYCALVAYEL